MPTTPASLRLTSTGEHGIMLAAMTLRTRSSGLPAPERSTGGSHGTAPIPAWRLRKSWAPKRRCHNWVVGIAATRSVVAGSGHSTRRRAASSDAALARSRRSVSRASAKRLSSDLRSCLRRDFCSYHEPTAITGLRTANMAYMGFFITAMTSGTTTAMMLNFAPSGISLGSGQTIGSGRGGWPGRGGRLNGAVPAGVTLCSDPARGAGFS